MMGKHEFCAWTMMAFCWIGMAEVASRLLRLFGIDVPDLLSTSWTWKTYLLQGLTLPLAFKLVSYVVMQIHDDATADARERYPQS
jgi:hypothetical protein